METRRVVGFFDRGAIAYHDDRLHFTAFVGGLPTKSTPPPVVELLSGGKVVASMPMFAHDAWNHVFICRGVSAFRMTDYPQYVKECSFPGLTAGSYTLAIRHGGTRLATEHLSLVQNRYVDGRRFLAVRPKDRTEQGYVSQVRIVYWHQVDLRDQAEFLQFIWMNGETIERPPNHAHSELSRITPATGGPLWERDTPLVDVVPVKGPVPHADWAAPRLRLLVFREGKELLATHKIEIVERDQVAILRPATDVTEKQIRIARKEAIELNGEPGEQGLKEDRTWPENVVCDVASNPKRLAELNGWVNNNRGAQVRAQLSRETAKASRERWRTEEQRRELEQRSKTLKAGAAQKEALMDSSETKLRGLGHGYKKGCFEKMAPVR